MQATACVPSDSQQAQNDQRLRTWHACGGGRIEAAREQRWLHSAGRRQVPGHVCLIDTGVQTGGGYSV